MSKTDQAFIDAFGRQQSQLAAADTAAMTPPHGTHGPHVRFPSGGKAPLSQMMQSRTDASHNRQEEVIASAAADSTPLIAKTQIARFAWPTDVELLIKENAGAYANLVQGLQWQWPMLGLVGCGASCGVSTTTMALAKLLAKEKARVAIIDADPKDNQLATELGLVRHPTLASILAEGGQLADATLHAFEDNISLLVAGSLTQHPAMLRQAVLKLRDTHDVVIIDLGVDPQVIRLEADALALVHRFDESEAVVEYTCRLLNKSPAKLVGSIRTMAPAA